MPAQGDWQRQAAGFWADLIPGAVPRGVSADIAELILAVHAGWQPIHCPGSLGRFRTEGPGAVRAHSGMGRRC
jgi:hypothetical protein